jgi:uncharacterized membrane protein YraQ (UPF0718 family)
MEKLLNASTLFFSLLVEAIPFLLIGVVLSSVLMLVVDENKLVQKIPHNPILGALIGSLIGFLFPVCECGNVPVARRLLTQGVPTSVAIAFLLAAPTINPVVIWSTWIAFRDQPEIVLFRVIFSLSIAMIMACIFSLQKDPDGLFQGNLVQRLEWLEKQKQVKKDAQKPALLSSGSFLLGNDNKPISLTDLPVNPIKRSTPKNYLRYKNNVVIENILQELKELGGMLILGSAIAATIQIFVPREFILSLGHGTITSVLAMMLLAAFISICSTVDAFFALSFASTFTSGSLLAFLVFGPMIDIKAIGLMLSIFKPRIIAYLLVIVAQLTFIFSVGYSYLN